jgi:hypothetical protein
LPSDVRSPEFGVQGFPVPPEIIVLAVRWYPLYGLPYRDLEELLAERGIKVDSVTSSGGCSALHRSLRTRPGRAGAASVIVGSSTRRM